VLLRLDGLHRQAMAVEVSGAAGDPLPER
jgi:hypothetical protein